MNDFNVFDIFGKQIVGINRVRVNVTELLFDDKSRLVFTANQLRQELYVDYLEAQ